EVNQVGINVNTASSSLLEHVAGLSKTIARNIVVERDELGKFTSRNQLKKVPRLEKKTYEQRIVFLRIIDRKHPLDQTPIHPESYKVTEQLLGEVGFTLEDVGTEALREALATVDVEDIAEKLEVGVMTLRDIRSEERRVGE